VRLKQIWRAHRSRNDRPMRLVPENVLASFLLMTLGDLDQVAYRLDDRQREVIGSSLTCIMEGRLCFRHEAPMRDTEKHDFHNAKTRGHSSDLITQYRRRRRCFIRHEKSIQKRDSLSGGTFFQFFAMILCYYSASSKPEAQN
jgi:hypothetical protein